LVSSNTINTATATDLITIADDVAIMLDEAEFHPAAVKPVFRNLLLRDGVAPIVTTKLPLVNSKQQEAVKAQVICVHKTVNAVSKQLLYEES